MKDYNFLNRAEYFKTLAAHIAKTKRAERVMVATMDFDPNEPLIAKLLGVMRAAAQRGAQVTLLVDAHTFLVDEHGIPGPLFYRSSLVDFRGVFGERLAALKSLEADGGTFCVTNIPRRRFNPSPIGRSHIKAAVVGNEIFIGGCNLEKSPQIDVMVNWHNKHAADTIEGWLQRIVEIGQVREALGDVDSEVPIGGDCRLLIDAGVPHQSLVYDEALQFIDTAKEWLFITCQFFPGGETARRLAAAKARGVHVTIAYGHPRTQGTSAPLQHLHQLSQRAKGLPRDFFAGQVDKRHPKLHAKVLASDQGAIIGSHNFVVQGVNFGTAELALRTSDATFARDITTFVQEQLRVLGN